MKRNTIYLLLILGNIICTTMVVAEGWEKPMLSAVYDEEIGELTKEIFIRRITDPDDRAARMVDKEDRYHHYRMITQESKLAAEAFMYQYQVLLGMEPDMKNWDKNSIDTNGGK